MTKVLFQNIKILYAILTLVMLLAITVLRVDFGPMKRHEVNAIAGDLVCPDT